MGEQEESEELSRFCSQATFLKRLDELQEAGCAIDTTAALKVFATEKNLLLEDFDQDLDLFESTHKFVVWILRRVENEDALKECIGQSASKLLRRLMQLRVKELQKPSAIQRKKATTMSVPNRSSPGPSQSEIAQLTRRLEACLNRSALKKSNKNNAASDDSEESGSSESDSHSSDDEGSESSASESESDEEDEDGLKGFVISDDDDEDSERWTKKPRCQ